jgi:hypothetical protein
LIFASDTPGTNRHMSVNEKEYIRACKSDEKIQDTNSVGIKFVILFCNLLILENTMGINASISRFLVYSYIHVFL